VVDGAVMLTGAHGLKLDAALPGSGVRVTSDEMPVAPGATYLFSLAYRQEGFSSAPKGRDVYCGVSSSASVGWYDAAHQPLTGTAPSRFRYGATDWKLSDILASAPTHAAFARIGAVVGNGSERKTGVNIPSTLWLDAVQFRPYAAPPTPEWARGKTAMIVEGGMDASPVKTYFVAGNTDFRNSRGGPWSEVVLDPEAERGSALEARGSGRGLMAHSTYFTSLPPGLYRMRVRVRVSDNRGTERVGSMEVNTALSGGRLLLDIVPASFEAPNTYQVLEKDFILRDDGWWCVRLYTEGKQPWAIDSIKVIPLKEFTDEETLSIYPGSEGQVPPSLRPPNGGELQALVIAGLGSDRFRLADSLRLLARDVRIRPVWVKTGSTTEFVDFPLSAEELFENRLIVMANVPANALSLRRKQWIREYVRRGGALLVIGGHRGFERGSWKGSLLEQIMPVTIKESLAAGLHMARDGALLTFPAACTWRDQLDLESAPRVYYQHVVTPKAGSRVVAEDDEMPFAVLGDYERGRVACVMGWASGDPAPGTIRFWQWGDWPYFLRSLCWAAMRQDLNYSPVHWLRPVTNDRSAPYGDNHGWHG